YVESLSSYARQFLGRHDKPDVDSIDGISPAIAIEQKVTGGSARSTVGTVTEIYDYVKLLFARIGRTYSPISGKEVTRHTVADVVNWMIAQGVDSRLTVLTAILKVEELQKQIQLWTAQGYTRLYKDGEIIELEECKDKKGEVALVIDRIVITADEDDAVRLADSVSSAFEEGQGHCSVLHHGTNALTFFSSSFTADGIKFEEPSVNLFTFNNPFGACKTCEGFGSIIGIDEQLVIPNQTLSVYQDAVLCWRGETMSEWKHNFIRTSAKFKFPVHRPIHELSAEQNTLLWEGNKEVAGIRDFFRFLESESYKIQYRVMLSRYRGKTACPDCEGTRLRKDANYVKVDGMDISTLVRMQIGDCLNFFRRIKINSHEQKVAGRILIEIKNRLEFLCNVGLQYLTLNRLSSTLSGGESQRIQLATSLGSALVGSTYILDEPSIGLHARDTERLIDMLHDLKKQGNTVVVVEHDEEIMRSADHIIDLGPEAGVNGGAVVYEGNAQGLVKSSTLNAQYLNSKLQIQRKARQLKPSDCIEIVGAREHSLKNIHVKFPLHGLVVVCGVSGSGKSTLVRNILYPALQRELGGIPSEKIGKFDKLGGDFHSVYAVEFVDQNPIGRSTRSNPVTYLKAYDEIRQLFASMPLARQRSYTAGNFSFNVQGGRCEACEGEGVQTITMQFMADIRLMCEECNGKRFQSDILEVLYKEKSISDVLAMTVDEAVIFFDGDKAIHKSLVEKLKALQEVGMGYVALGQSSSTLSGGEAQRIKLASFLIKGNISRHTLFIFDEPTTGLHFHDVNKLLMAFQALIDKGHSIIAVEHQQDVIRCADWVIELGPEGGNAGGNIIFEGKPDDMKDSTPTGKSLK
ncbi:MAG: excinuclease ABC subunit UvrA, partial [Flavobacteriales bacterium]